MSISISSGGQSYTAGTLVTITSVDGLGSARDDGHGGGVG